MRDYPECEKMQAVAELSQAIGDFIEWLPSVGIHLCDQIKTRECTYGVMSFAGATCIGGRLIDRRTGNDIKECPQCHGKGEMPAENGAWFPTSQSITKLLAQHFGIDLAKVDREQRAMLERIRDGHPQDS